MVGKIPPYVRSNADSVTSILRLIHNFEASSGLLLDVEWTSRRSDTPNRGMRQLDLQLIDIANSGLSAVAPSTWLLVRMK